MTLTPARRRAFDIVLTTSKFGQALYHRGVGEFKPPQLQWAPPAPRPPLSLSSPPAAAPWVVGAVYKHGVCLMSAKAWPL
ncbi:MAG: hypothetical protein QXT46_03995 [Pyrobaculum sp.]